MLLMLTLTEAEMNWSIKSHNKNHHAIFDVSEDESQVVAEVYSARGTARTMANAEELLVAAIDLVKGFRQGIRHGRIQGHRSDIGNHGAGKTGSHLPRRRC